MFRKNHRQHKKLHNQAYLAFDAGDLQTAADKFAELAKAHPDNAQYRYMLGLAAKYRMDWALSLQANLAAIACAPEFDEAAHWNAAIAATALHDWQTVRQLWAACGIPLPEGEGEGEIEADFGTAVLRLNPWADGECVYARRIDPCRSRIINIPPPARKRLPHGRHRTTRRRIHRQARRRPRRRSLGIQRIGTLAAV
ncbi:hypothetical protein [Neisseria elongata]